MPHFSVKRSLVPAVLVTSCLLGSAQGQPALWTDAPSVRAPEPSSAPTVVKRGSVQIDFDRLAGLRPEGGDALTIHLLDGAHPVGVFERKVSRSPDSYSWFGRLEGEEGSSLILVFHQGVAAGYIRSPRHGTFELTSLADDAHEIREIDHAGFLPCASGPAESVRTPVPDQKQVGRGGDNGSVIDVLVVYTPEARIAQGGTTAIEARIILAVDAANASHSNSLINPTLNLVHMAETIYTETGNASTELSRLRSTSDGHMDEVHALRNQYGADLVSLIVNDFNACGIGYLMTTLSTGFASSAFTVTDKDCAVGNLSFAHELGHNMGCHHDHDNGGPPVVYNYAFGHRFTAGSTFRTVMAYAPGTRIQHFSNPNVNYLGVPTGVQPGQPEEAYNAQVINNTALTVANFRASVPTDTTPPSPDPMQWETGGEPDAISSSEITMTAALATDTQNSVEYCLTGVSGPGVGSLCWQAVRTFTDTGLSTNTAYSYDARARDTAIPPNETLPSSPALNATTFIETPTTIFLGAPTDTSVSMTGFNPVGTFSNLAVGSSGLFFEMTPPGGVNANVWVQAQFIDATGLSPGTEYTVRVKARNQLGVETPFSPVQMVTTTGAAGCILVGDVNQDGLINGADIDGYIRAKLGQAPALGEDPLCANFGNAGDLALDTAAFVSALLLN